MAITEKTLHQIKLAERYLRSDNISEIQIEFNGQIFKCGDCVQLFYKDYQAFGVFVGYDLSKHVFLGNYQYRYTFSTLFDFNVEKDLRIHRWNHDSVILKVPPMTKQIKEVSIHMTQFGEFIKLLKNK